MLPFTASPRATPPWYCSSAIRLRRTVRLLPTTSLAATDLGRQFPDPRGHGKFRFFIPLPRFLGRHILIKVQVTNG